MTTTTPKDWETEFELEYGLTMEDWTLGIVAATLDFARTNPLGSDASHITKMLRSKVRQLLLTSYEELEKEIEGKKPKTDTSEMTVGEAEEVALYDGIYKSALSLALEIIHKKKETL